MTLSSMPEHTRLIHARGYEIQVAVALLLMDDPLDDGRTTGWYWTPVPPDPTEADLVSAHRWNEAVRHQQGPFRDAQAAFRGAEHVSERTQQLGQRLEQAAALVRAGEVVADAAQVADWLRDAQAEDDRRARKDGRAAEAAADADAGASPVPVRTDEQWREELWAGLRVADTGPDRDPDSLDERAAAAAARDPARQPAE